MSRMAKWFFIVPFWTMVTMQTPDQYGSATNQFRQGKDLLDWIGLGTGPNVDPYLGKTNAACLNGDLAECFKSRALASLDEFFNQPVYHLTENARVLRLPETQLRHLSQEAYEYSSSPRADEPEWDQLVKFGMRKVEKFLKSTGIEVSFDDENTEHGKYSPRFVDDIVDEIDVIEDKKDTLFNRKQLKKLFIPMLLILKIFKLKLLLFLPLILGLASFKKILGLLAIVIPGLIGFFKLCKPNLQSGFGGHHYGGGSPQYSPAGVGYQPHFREPQPSFSHEYSDTPYYGGSSKGLTFRDEHRNPQDIAYSGYSHYRNKDSDIKGEDDGEKRRKSILPDS